MHVAGHVKCMVAVTFHIVYNTMRLSMTPSLDFVAVQKTMNVHMALEVVVGEGVEGYDKIVSTFEQYSKGMYARVSIVNPLHECMPKLALSKISTCNKFTTT